MGPERDDQPTASAHPPEEPAEEPAAGDEAAEGFDRWREKSAVGGIGTGIARGLQAVFAPPLHEVTIVAAVPGEPPDADTRLRVVLHPYDPTKSIAVVPATAPDPPSS